MNDGPSAGSCDAPRAIIVMGVSGCGKSTVGKLVAATLHCPFVEGDDYHPASNIAKMRAGRPLDDADRWPWLDALGAAIGNAVKAGDRVIASCSALKRSYRERLIAAIDAPALFVLLDVGRAELERRMASRTHHFMPAALLDSQLDTIEPPGADECALTLDGEQPAQMLCNQLLARLDGGAEARPVRVAGQGN
jgi:gluconokinase